MAFPANLDSFVNPSGSDKLDAPNHSVQHSEANDAIESLQLKVGIDSSADTSSLDYKVTQNTAHRGIVTGNPHAVTKSEVGLGNVDNTSDATKNAATATLTNKTIDGSQLVDSSVATAKIATGAVTSDKLALEEVIVPSASLTSATFTAVGTYTNLGWNLTLPTIGTWVIVSSVRVQITSTAAGVYARIILYDDNVAAEVPNSRRIAAYVGYVGTLIENINWNLQYVTTNTNTVVGIRATRSSASMSVSGVYTDANGYSYLRAYRIA